MKKSEIKKLTSFPPEEILFLANLVNNIDSLQIVFEQCNSWFDNAEECYEWVLRIEGWNAGRQAFSQIGNDFNSSKEAIAYAQGYQFLNDKLKDTRDKMQNKITELKDKIEEIEKEKIQGA